MKMKINLITGISICFFSIMSGCDDGGYLRLEKGGHDEIKSGVIMFFPPPDNCNDYIFRTHRDEVRLDYYKPDNLPDEFKTSPVHTDSIPVEIAYRMTGEKHNCGFGGYVPIIHIIKIKKL
jgi:hypothetical protein